MKLSDHDKVIELVKTLNRIDAAIRELEASMMKHYPTDSYWGHLSMHPDGSGRLVDLRGCHVCGDVMTGVDNILHAKRLSVISELESYGVDTGSGEKSDE